MTIQFLDLKELARKRHSHWSSNNHVRARLLKGTSAGRIPAATASRLAAACLLRFCEYLTDKFQSPDGSAALWVLAGLAGSAGGQSKCWASPTATTVVTPQITPYQTPTR